MTEFKGFATMEAAKQFVKERGNGLICWDKKTKSGKPTKTAEYYWFAAYAGLDTEKYPYCVQWNA